MMKRCTKCDLDKPLAAFGRKAKSRDGLNWWCKACNTADQMARYHSDVDHGRAINQRSAAKRIDKKRAEDRAYSARTKPQKREYDRNYRETNREPIQHRLGLWRAANRKHLSDKCTERRRADPIVRLAHNIGVQMRYAIRGRKGDTWCRLVGYSASELKSHLKSQFVVGMSWINYGSEWHIDHKRPILTFDLPRQIAECWALSNLQPLWSGHNIAKGARWNGFDPRTLPRKTQSLER